MSASGFITVGKILSFSSVVEFATGLALIAAPPLVARLLLGADIAGIAIALARFLGVGLLGLGLACWRGKASAATDAPAFRGMLVYNSLVALYLGYLGFVGHASGVLLWPAVALHAAVAVALAWASCTGKKAKGVIEASPR